MNEHPTTFELERFSVGDLPPADDARVRAHAEACASCRGALEELEYERRAQLARRPPAAFVAAVAARRGRTRRRWWRVGLPAAGLAVAAAAAVVLLLPGDPGVRMKGAAAVAAYRARGGQVTRLGDEGGPVAPGDAVQLVVTLPRRESVAAWAVEVGGRIEPLTEGALTLEAGERTLPHSAVVEAPCREARLVVVLGVRDYAATQRAVREAGLEAKRVPGARVVALSCR
jgi:hypothetical protein